MLRRVTTLDFRPYQKECLEKNLASLSDKVLLNVLPPGAGKTFIFVQLVKKLFVRSDLRFLIINPKVNICSQSAEEFRQAGLSSSVYCSSLGEKKISSITCATIQSACNIEEHFDFLILDEAHHSNMEDSSSQYYKFIESCQRINPKLIIIGFTATPYTGNGEKIYGKDMFWSKPIFHTSIKNLTDQGYLCPVVMRGNNLEINYRDPENMETSGEDVYPKIKEIVADALNYSKNRNCVLWITPTIKIANQVHSLVSGSSCVHSGWSKKWNEESMSYWKKNGGHMISVNMASEGFNHPPTDCMVAVRPIRSKKLYVQAVGRITRTHGSKSNGLLLDYGNIVENLGDLYSINGDKPRGRALKMCPMCSLFMGNAKKSCHACGFEFATFEQQKDFAYSDPTKNLTTIASRGYPKTVEVSKIAFAMHTSRAKKENVKIRFFEKFGGCHDLYIGIEKNYYNWKRWKTFCEKYCVSTPDRIDLTILKRIILKGPLYITLDKQGKYTNVML